MIAGLVIAAAALAAALRFRALATRASAETRRVERIAGMCADLRFVVVDRDRQVVFAAGEPVGDAFSLLGDEVARAFAGEASRVEGDTADAYLRIDVLPFDAEHVVLTVRDISNGKALQRSLEVERTFLSAVLSQLGDRVHLK
jgi:hypothetical protein